MYVPRTLYQIILMMIVSLILLTTEWHSMPPVLASSRCAGGTCTTYLPLVVGPTSLPQLLAPDDGAVVNSVAPLLSWMPQQPGTYHVDVAFDSAFTTIAFSSTLAISGSLQTQTFVMDGNILMKTLYWRVGIQLPDGMAFSPARSFTTPDKNTNLLPPAPHLLSPANQAQLTTPDVTLQWASVPNSLYYRVGIYTADGTQVTAAILAAPTTMFHAVGLMAHTSYTWKVKALNQYGWSAYSTKWTFTTP